MKLLFDQNISFRVIKKIALYFPEAKQVRELGLENRNDFDIWQFAKQQGYTIVTFDADFYELSNLYGFPPKVIWLRLGNTTTETIANLFLAKKSLIELFLQPESDPITCLEII